MNKKIKFKVGDKVKILNDSYFYKIIGKVGTIYSLNECQLHKLPYPHIKIDGNSYCPDPDGKIELVTPKRKVKSKKECICTSTDGLDFGFNSESCPVHKTEKRGRSKKDNQLAKQWQKSISTSLEPHVTFPITTLPNGIQLIHIPMEEWSQVDGIVRHFVFVKQQKKQKVR